MGLVTRALRAIGLGLTIAGVAMAVISVLGLVFAWGSTKGGPPAQVAANASTATVPSSASPAASGIVTATAALSTATASAQEETVAQFLPLFAAAIQTGNTSFLVGRLNPHVIEIYGEANCVAAVASMTDPTASFTINSTSGPAPFTWLQSGTPIPVEDAYTVSVTRISRGQSSVQDIHLAVVQEQLTWFRSCAPAPAQGGG